MLALEHPEGKLCQGYLDRSIEAIVGAGFSHKLSQGQAMPGPGAVVADGVGYG